MTQYTAEPVILIYKFPHGIFGGENVSGLAAEDSRQAALKSMRFGRCPLERPDIILIGPSGVGKSTVSKELAERLQMPRVSLDAVRQNYYRDLDYDEEKAQQLRQEDYEGLLRYWEPFNVQIVTRALADYPGSIFDFGAIHSVYEDPALFRQVAAVLAPYPNVILLLPSADKDESVKILHDRGKEGTNLDPATLAMWWRIIERFVKHPDNTQLAKHTLYTKDKTPQQTLAEVLSVVQAI